MSLPNERERMMALAKFLEVSIKPEDTTTQALLTILEGILNLQLQIVTLLETHKDLFVSQQEVNKRIVASITTLGNPLEP